MEKFISGQEITGYFTELSVNENAPKGILGNVVEVKEHTGIIVCEFKLKRTTIIEDFTMEGVSIRGKVYGHITSNAASTVITPKPDLGEEIANLVEEARVAFKADNQKGFVAAQTKIFQLGDANSRGAVDLLGIVTGFCKSGEEKPSPEMIQAIRKCLHK